MLNTVFYLNILPQELEEKKHNMNRQRSWHALQQAETSTDTAGPSGWQLYHLPSHCQVSEAGRLQLHVHTTRRHGALVIGDRAGADAAVCACVTAPTATAVGHGIIELRVAALRAARDTDSLVHQGERHTATLDQKIPPKTPLQIGVLKKWKVKTVLLEIVSRVWHFLHELMCVTGDGFQMSRGTCWY